MKKRNIILGGAVLIRWTFRREFRPSLSLKTTNGLCSWGSSLLIIIFFWVYLQTFILQPVPTITKATFLQYVTLSFPLSLHTHASNSGWTPMYTATIFNIHSNSELPQLSPVVALMLWDYYSCFRDWGM